MVSTNLQVLAKEGVGSLQTSTQATTSNNDPQAPQDEQTWDGVTTTDVFERENYRITYTLTGYWNGGYNANIQIDNTGSETIENWILNFDYPGTISKDLQNSMHYKVN